MNQFETQLKKGKTNQEGREACNCLYRYLFRAKGFNHVAFVNYDENSINKCLQASGVDVVLSEVGKNGYHRRIFCIEEKLLKSKKPYFYFEYEKMSGSSGWAVNDRAFTDFIFYYLDGTVYVMLYKELRDYLKENHEHLKKHYDFESYETNSNGTRKKGNKCFAVPVHYALSEFVTENGKGIIIPHDKTFLDAYKQEEQEL